MPLTQDEIARGLAQQYGIDPTRAAELATRVESAPGRDAPPSLASDCRIRQVNAAPVSLEPVRLTLPWDALCPDNARHGILDTGKGPRIWTSKRYRKAKQAASTIGYRAMSGRPPIAGPVRVDALVWFPDTENGRRGDAPNFAKGAHDALEGSVYVKDSQIHDARWRRAGADRENPRAEITVTPIAEP